VCGNNPFRVWTAMLLCTLGCRCAPTQGWN